MDSNTSDIESVSSDTSDTYEINDEPSFINNSNTFINSQQISDPPSLSLEPSIELEDEYEDTLPNIEHIDINIFHPELKSINYKELLILSKVKKDKDGNIKDSNHRTIPILTKYEKTKILGQRAKQIEEGHLPFIKINNIIDHYTIAQMELEQNKIPFIIRRPLPNGNSEYWRVQDLTIL